MLAKSGGKGCFNGMDYYRFQMLEITHWRL